MTTKGRYRFIEKIKKLHKEIEVESQKMFFISEYNNPVFAAKYLNDMLKMKKDFIKNWDSEVSAKNKYLADFFILSNPVIQHDDIHVDNRGEEYKYIISVNPEDDKKTKIRCFQKVHFKNEYELIFSGLLSQFIKEAKEIEEQWEKNGTKKKKQPSEK